jgi:two-component system phosphate regulon sensor histidine kinase PhoR
VIELRRAAVVILLFVGLGIGLHLLLTPLREAGQPASAKTLVLAIGVVLSVLGLVGGYLVARLPKQRIDALALRLENFVRRGKVGLVISEAEADALGRLGHAVNRYLTFVKDEVEQSHIAAKEEQIQMKVLAAEKRHVEAVIHAISDAVVVTDAFGDLVLANAAAERLFEFTFDAARHTPVDEVIQDKPFLGLLSEMRDTGLFTSSRTVEWTQGTGAAAPKSGPVPGRTFQVILNTVLEGRKHDRISGVVAVLHDVTRERESAKMKSDFVSNVSHELKAPLASVKAYAELLQEGEAKDENTRREFLQIIVGETDRLNRLIESILNLSRMESGLVPVNKTELAVTEILHDVVDVMTPQALKKSIRLEADLAPVFFRVYGDRDMLYQTFLNVVSNAVKYTPEGGQVRISTYLEDSTVVVKVQDSGKGIPEDEVGRIFDKFYRGKGADKSAAGTGLGLALVKHVMETVHGGRITVTSEVGKGASFHLHLPAVR